MGCGASAEQKETKPKRKYVEEDEEEDKDSQELGSETHSTSSRKSVSSNKFTASYASGRSPRLQGAYNPMFVPEDVLPWKQPRREPEKSTEEFVFGDFSVDPGDVQVQRVERINRVKRAFSLTRKKSMSSGSHFVMNDFSVVVDETDDFEVGNVEEPVVPAGFRTLKGCTLTTLTGHTSRVKTIAIAPHEKHFASASMEDSAITLTNMDSGEEITNFIGHISPIIAACFSRDGKYLATSSRDNSVIIWDVSSSKEGQRKQVRCLEHSTLPICCAFSYSGVHMITGCQNKQCLVWDVARAVEIVTYDQHEGVVVCIAPLQGQDVVATGGGDRIIRMWDTTTGTTIRQFIGHDGVVISLSFTSDGERILSNDDRACKIWLVQSGACACNITLDSLTKPPPPLFPGVTREYTQPTPLQRAYYEKHKVPMRSYGFGANGILGPQALNACRIAAHRAVFTLSCLCPGELSNSYFAVASTNKTVYIVSIANGKEVLSFNAKSAVFAIASGRGDKIVFGDIFGNIYRVSMRASTEPLR
jgi:WD40 repeat protein